MRKKASGANGSGRSRPVVRLWVPAILHSASEVVGNIGTTNRQQYNITGTVVIQAARIEQLNKQYNSQILVSQEVMDELSSIPVSTKRVGTTHLKGITKDVMLCQLA